MATKMVRGLEHRAREQLELFRPWAGVNVN